MDGTKGTILSSAAPIEDRNRKVLGAVGVQQDITEQVKLERELAEAKGRAEFYIDLLTHDIDNSLASVSGYLQLIGSSANLDPRSQRWLSGASASLQEPLDLIATVRKVQQSRTMALERTTIDLNEILQEAVINAQNKNMERVKISLTTVENARVVGSELLRDLFNNLIGNAIKHSTGPVTVDVDVRPVTFQNQEFYRIDVTDDGKGIPDALKDRLFNKGVRGGSKAPGQGLGLFLSQNIVAGAGGRIWVEDRIPGDHTKGTRFIVLLPMTE
jgi:signal transduction histidine kinase